MTPERLFPATPKSMKHSPPIFLGGGGRGGRHTTPEWPPKVLPEVVFGDECPSGTVTCQWHRLFFGSEVGNFHFEETASPPEVDVCPHVWGGRPGKS